MSGLLERLDGAAARRWVAQAAGALELAAAEINALNVFPIPDRDTGTNMLLTLRSAATAVDERPGADVGKALDAAATGALAGACGSSGAILASYLRGFADASGGQATIDGPALAAALTGAAESAYAAVSAPVEGTILSVARAAAAAVRAGDAVAAAAAAAAAGARVELARTTQQLPALAAADVVDAGGRGLIVVLDALVDVTHGVERSVSPPLTNASATAAGQASAPRFAYEVQYLLEAPIDASRTLTARLRQLGDSVVVVTGADQHKVHVHVNDVGAAIEAALDLGRPSDIRVTHFGDQSTPGSE